MAILWIKVCSVGMEIHVLLLPLVLCQIVRNILNVDEQQIEFAIDLDVNPVIY